MNGVVSDATIAGVLICDMLNDRAFHRAAESLDKFGHTLHSNDLWSLLEATCTNYDRYQYNEVDERENGRKRFVTTLASLVVHSTDTPQRFVHPVTALACAFHIATRLLFVELAAKHYSVVVAQIFNQTSYVTHVCKLFACEHLTPHGGLLAGLSLQDIYWGRDFDKHVDMFLRYNIAPFIASWHGAAEQKLRHHSLVIDTPTVPYLSTVARVIRSARLVLSNVDTCGAFLDDDPDCAKRAPIADAVLVGRHVYFSLCWRFCWHFGRAKAERIDAVTDPELWLAIDEAIRGMAIGFESLSSYVKMFIIERVVRRVPNGVIALRRVERVDKVVAEIRAARRHTKRIKND